MEIRQYKAGEIIYRVGDYQKEAYRILKGKVAISKIVKNTPILLGILEKDDIFGELTLITDKPHYLTAQAMEAVEVEVLTEENFNKLILSNPQAILPYLNQLFESVRSALDTLSLESDDNISSPSVETDEHHEPHVLFVTTVHNNLKQATLTLKANNDLTARRSPRPEMMIKKFPFSIGRENTSGGFHLFGGNNFNIKDHIPLQVSRHHCVIEKEGNQFFIKDRGSRLGTIVNGEVLGHETGKYKTEIKVGKNTLTLGMKDSKIQYTITLSGQKDVQQNQEIEALKAKIDLAISDGVLSKEEFEDIKADIYADEQVTTDEAVLIMSLMEKVTKGEVKLGE